MTRGRLPAILFDMDGVLVDSNEAHFEAFRRMGEKLGTPFTRELLLRTIGMHNNGIFPLWLGPELSPERLAELALEKERLYRSIVTEPLADGSTRLRAIPGSVELVRALHAEGLALAVGSSGPRANVELAVRTLGIGPLFRALVTGDDVKHGKPAPDIFLKAAAALGEPPSNCVVIEDAPQGIQAALAAGMKVVAVATSKAPADLAAAHRVAATMSELSPRALVELSAAR